MGTRQAHGIHKNMLAFHIKMDTHKIKQFFFTKKDKRINERKGLRMKEAGPKDGGAQVEDSKEL